MTTSTRAINATLFLADLDKVRKERRLTWNQVFKQTYVTNLPQIVRGKRALTRAQAGILAKWAGLNMANYCDCQHPNALTCQSERYRTTRFNALISYGACSCPCHRAESEASV